MKGGGIGVGIAGDVSNLFMVWWDRKLYKEIIDKGLVMKHYCRYVDDTNVVIKAIQSMEDKEKDENTMLKIQEIANSIHSSIKVTIDFPSNHENGVCHVLTPSSGLKLLKLTVLKSFRFYTPITRNP